MIVIKKLDCKNIVQVRLLLSYLAFCPPTMHDHKKLGVILIRHACRVDTWKTRGTHGHGVSKKLRLLDILPFPLINDELNSI